MINQQINPVTRSVLKYVRDIMNFDPENMEAGRINEEIISNEIDYIAVDSIFTANRVGAQDNFDGDTEVETLSNNFRQEFTISFYGPNAYDNVDRFISLQRTESSYNLKIENNINIQVSGSFIDVKKLTGKQYINRLDVSVFVVYNKTININTRRIDTLQYELYTNN